MSNEGLLITECKRRSDEIESYQFNIDRYEAAIPIALELGRGDFAEYLENLLHTERREQQKAEIMLLAAKVVLEGLNVREG